MFIKRPRISLLITVFSDREEQLNISLRSLTRHKFNPSLVELLIFIDYPNSSKMIGIIKNYREYFSSVKLFIVEKKLQRLNHSVTRRNFLAKKASGEFIIFTEPEILHLGNSVKTFLSYCNNKYKKSWICGPTYASGEMVDTVGKLVDRKYNPADFIFLKKLVGSKSILKNPGFQKRFHKIDYRFYSTPFFCVMFNRDFFLKSGGLNQGLKIRGYEEVEFYSRFSKMGGNIIIDKNIVTIHIPHLRSTDHESQISWNLYNSTITFDHLQHIGEIRDAIFTSISL